jgi:putative superfamily III holin-X
MTGRPARDGGMSDDRSLDALVDNLNDEAHRLVRREVELAKLDLRQEMQQTTEAGKRLAVAAGAAIVAVLLLSFALVWGLAEVMPLALAFLLVGAAYAVVAAGAALQAREQFPAAAAPDMASDTSEDDVASENGRLTDRTRHARGVQETGTDG